MNVNNRNARFFEGTFSAYFQQPLPPNQCWQGRKHPSMQRSNVETWDPVFNSFENIRNSSTLEKSPWYLQHWIGGKGLENKRSTSEKRSFRRYTLKNEETRMRAKDFGTPLVWSFHALCSDQFDVNMFKSISCGENLQHSFSFRKTVRCVTRSSVAWSRPGSRRWRSRTPQNSR